MSENKSLRGRAMDDLVSAQEISNAYVKDESKSTYLSRQLAFTLGRAIICVLFDIAQNIEKIAEDKEKQENQ